MRKKRSGLRKNKAHDTEWKAVFLRSHGVGRGNMDGVPHTSKQVLLREVEERRTASYDNKRSGQERGFRIKK